MPPCRWWQSLCRGGEAERGYEHFPVACFLLAQECLPQGCVRTHAATEGNAAYACLLDGHFDLFHQYLHDGLLERGCKILLMVLDELRVFLLLVAEEIEERCLQP